MTMYKDNQEDLFGRLITQNETCVYPYEPETKAQSKQWKHYDLQPPKKARVLSYAGKTLLTVFLNQRGEEKVDILAKGTIITGAYYA